MYYVFFLLFSLCHLDALFTGNPSLGSFDPLSKESSLVSFRAAYVYDNVYRQRFQDFTILNELPQENSFLSYSLQGALFTFNLLERLDLYAIGGKSRLNFDNNLISPPISCFAVGSKALLYKGEWFRLGVDGKYFQADYLKFSNVVSADRAYPIVGPLNIHFFEWQGSIGIACNTPILSPYIQATYIYSELSSIPSRFLFAYEPDDLEDYPFSPLVNQSRLGMAFGVTLFQTSLATLTLESRFFNQNALHAKLEARF